MLDIGFLFASPLIYKELNSRSDLLTQKESHYRRMIYIKDQKIADMQRRIDNTGKNLDNVISAKLFEKGN